MAQMLMLVPKLKKNVQVKLSVVDFKRSKSTLKDLSTWVCPFRNWLYLQAELCEAE